MSRTRLALKLAACALAGAVLTVAAAWGIASQHRSWKWSWLASGDWPAAVPDSWPSQPSEVVGARRGGAWWTQWQELRPLGGQSWWWSIAQVGWPALAGSVEVRSSRLHGVETTQHDGLRIGRDRFLPLHPVWPGFALDTAFYGTIVFLLWSAPGVVRRRARKRRGRCAACGYDLRGSAGGPCPECGT